MPYAQAEKLLGICRYATQIIGFICQNMKNEVSFPVSLITQLIKIASWYR